MATLRGRFLARSAITAEEKHPIAASAEFLRAKPTRQFTIEVTVNL
jgi:hypothetical protein